MRKHALTLPILISFNELAWIALFGIILLYTAETARLSAERDGLAQERDRTKQESEDRRQQLAGYQAELADARRRLARATTGDTAVNQNLIGLKGELRRVALIVDCSASMMQGRKWEYTRSIIQLWLEYLPIEQCVLITFSDSVNAFPADDTLLDVVGSSGRDNRKKLLQQFDKVTPSGNTNTLAALQKAYSYADVDTIVLFTDGCPDNGSHLFDSEMAASIYALCREHERKVPINTVGLGNYFNKHFAEFLLRLPEETGGSFIGR